MLTFDYLSQVNRDRCNEWFHGIDAWDECQWALAIAGETGELCNVAKKLLRLHTAPESCRDNEKDPEDLRRKMLLELADIVIYCDLMTTRLGSHLSDAVVEKFNSVSQRVGCKWKIDNET